MQMANLVVMAVMGMGLVSTTQAQTFWDRFVPSTDPGEFRSQELLLDLYGFGATADKGGGDTDAWGPASA